MYRISTILIFIISLMMPFSALSKVVNPKSYGILKAKNGTERYEILLKCHQDAIRQGNNISYKGIKQLDIEVPKNAISIPLPQETDFARVKIYVKNKTKNHFLFVLEQTTRPIKVPKTSLALGKTVDILRKSGMNMLVVEDKMPWVSERKGFNHAVYRKDILLVENGMIQNSPIYNYLGRQAQPEVKFAPLSAQGYRIKGISMYRSQDSSFKTYLLSVDNQYNVEISDIAIYTPNDDTKYGDEAIRICNSINVKLKEIRIDGTYSQDKTYGYGICINNVRDLLVENFVAKAKWGVFYTSNICNVTLDNCSINRFDLHCYGKDITLKNCSFTGKPLPYSSLYGTLLYDHCTITDGDALNLRQDYNANTPFDVIWQNCTFNMSPSSNCIIRVGGLTEEKNSREELSEKCLPNITIKDCTINLDSELTRWYFIITGRIDYKSPVDNIASMKVDGLIVNGEKEVPYNISSGSFETKKPFNIVMKNSNLKIKGKLKSFDLSSANVGKSARIIVDNQTIDLEGPSLGSKIIDKLKNYFR